jgi:hypothetical protein
MRPRSDGRWVPAAQREKSRHRSEHRSKYGPWNCHALMMADSEPW